MNIPAYIFPSLGAANAACLYIDAKIGLPDLDANTLRYTEPMKDHNSSRWAVLRDETVDGGLADYPEALAEGTYDDSWLPSSPF